MQQVQCVMPVCKVNLSIRHCGLVQLADYLKGIIHQAGIPLADVLLLPL